ncbi:MAG: hypothetical protein WCL00_12330 [Bacteroidota bacterium]
MKEKEGFIDCPEQQVIIYVERENGEFGPMQTGSYLTRNYLSDYEEKRVHLENSLKDGIKKRENSAINYYMVLEELTLSELAARVGLRKRKVKKHLEYQGFQAIKETVLVRYADVFNVEVKQLLELMELSVQSK